MTAQKSRKPFLSLKLKALYLSSALFVVVMGLFALLGRAYLDRQFDTQREQTHRLYQSELTVLLERSVERLQQLQDTVVYLEGIAAAMQDGSEEALFDKFNNYWWKLRIDNQLQSAAFVNLNRESVLFWGDFVEVAPLARKLNDRRRTDWEVTCDNSCHLVVASLVESGDARYAVVFSTLLDPALETFTRITQSSVALVSSAAAADAHRQLVAWQKALFYSSRPDRDPALMQALATQVPIQALARQPHYLTLDGQHLEYAYLMLERSRAGENNAFVIISDVTQYRIDSAFMFREILLATIFGLVVTELILLAVLWKPTTQLQRITEALPLLAVNEFGALRQQFLRKGQAALVEDESDILRRAAINLSYQLETLHSLLSNRAEQLESRGAELEGERNFVLGVLNTAHAVILTQDAEGEILMVNRFGAELVGLESDRLVGRLFAALLDTEEQENILANLKRLAYGETGSFQHESRLLRPDGASRYVSWYHARLPHRDGERHEILSVGMDISEKIQAEESLDWLAGHDSLTGLMNRARFENELEEVLAASQRYGHTGALLMINLDQFKDVNDSSGHEVGDAMLRKVAARLLETAMDGHLVARLGGDEFAVILQDMDEVTAGETADRYCRALMQIALPGEGRIHRVSASIGVALFPAHGSRRTDLMTSVGLALRRAKEAGRNGWSIFNENELGKQRIHERVYWNEKVKQVLSDGRFDMLFQPIRDVRSGDITHYEALLRVHGDEGDVLPPDQFIQAAERSGLMQAMDERIIDRVMQHQAQLRAQGIQTRLSINLSGLSFRNANLLTHIRHCAEQHAVDPDSIIFEITETAAVADIDSACQMVEAIRAQGYLFALDDFGVGFSSLHYLKRLPVDYVKIDGSFIRNLDQSEDDRVLVKALVEISRAFGQQTVAEFVDSQAVLDVLQELGVDYAQGYFIAKPLPFQTICA